MQNLKRAFQIIGKDHPRSTYATHPLGIECTDSLVNHARETPTYANYEKKKKKRREEGRQGKIQRCAQFHIQGDDLQATHVSCALQRTRVNPHARERERYREWQRFRVTIIAHNCLIKSNGRGINKIYGQSRCSVTRASLPAVYTHTPTRMPNRVYVPRRLYSYTRFFFLVSHFETDAYTYSSSSISVSLLPGARRRVVPVIQKGVDSNRFYEDTY